MFCHVLPPSVLLYTPSPQPTLWRLARSPVPTQMICGLGWNTATSPIECTGASKVELQVTPLSVVRQSPPVAPATYHVLGLDSTTSMSTTRPLMEAGPMFRRRSAPRSVAENGAAAWADTTAGRAHSRAGSRKREERTRIGHQGR